MHLRLAMIILALVAGSASASRIVVIDLDDTIQPASLRYLERALREADQDAALAIVELDTPGGLLESLRAMTSAILASEVPVAVYVTPAGARAASAGFFLVLAADVAAMAPGTNTGAAHPVAVGTAEEEDVSLAKAVEDAAAFVRSLAQGRGRPADLAAKAVTESASYSAEEARESGLVDVVAADRPALIAALDGRTIQRFDGRTQRLALGDPEVVPIERTFAERVLTVLASPQLAYLLMMLGALGLLVELMSPGLIVPGVGGLLLLLVGLYAFSVLPVSLVGALLIIAGLGLLVAEVLVTSYGLLAVGGIAAFLVGSLMLVDSPIPALQIGPEVVIPVAIVLAALTAFLAVRAVRTRGAKAHTGTEAMIGERGTVVAPIAPDHEGKVFVHGEYWNATATEPVPAGTPVRVDAVDGLRVRVSRVALQGGLA